MSESKFSVHHSASNEGNIQNVDGYGTVGQVQLEEDEPEAVCKIC